MRIYSDMDLVAAEALRARPVGRADRLRAGRRAVGAGLRGAPRRRRQPAAAARGRGRPGARRAWSRLWRELDALEREHQLDFLREPDPGFAWAAYRWAEGDDLDDVLDGTDLAAGDFVRWVKQLLDLAGQVADAAGDGRRCATPPADVVTRPAPWGRGLLLAQRLTCAERGVPRPLELLPGDRQWCVDDRDARPPGSAVISVCTFAEPTLRPFTVTV